MRNPTVRCALVVVLILLTAPTTLIADIEGKGGFFDVAFDTAGRPGTRTVQWLWWPYFQVGSVPYVVYAACSRSDAEDNAVGTNKIRFKKVTLRGVDTDTVVSFRRRTVRLDNGNHEVVTWDASSAQSIASETAVIGRAEVQVKGTIDAGDFLSCELGVAELTGTHATAAQ